MPSEQLDIIFAMAHPDDIEITCGGTIAKLTKLGYQVGILHMTNGEPTPRGTPEIRARELAEAAQFLGVAHVETLSLPNRELFDNLEARYAVRDRVPPLSAEDRGRHGGPYAGRVARSLSGPTHPGSGTLLRAAHQVGRAIRRYTAPPDRLALVPTGAHRSRNRALAQHVRR